MNNTQAPELKEINSKILADGEKLPIVRLMDGAMVQTGTVATMLYNVHLYNAGERGDVEEELKAAIPTLVKVGLFDLFPIQEWIDGNNAGRTFVGEAAQRFLTPDKKSEEKKFVFPRFFMI